MSESPFKWTKVGRTIESATRKALLEYDLVPENGRIAIALSGGKDSMTLALMLAAISGKGFAKFSLHAFHVAGAFSCGAGIDQGYLRQFCEDLGMPLTVLHTEQDLATLECYSCSRTRRKLLFDAAKSEGYHAMAFGHHADDNAQTILMNLLHKGEFAGNLPKLLMHKYEMTILRPLIYVREEQVIEFSKVQGFARIMCRCPVGQTSVRKTTKDLIAELERTFPNAGANLARASLLYGSQKAADL